MDTLATEAAPLPREALNAAARLLGAGRVRPLAELTTSGRSRVVRLEVDGGSSPGAVLKWGGDYVAASACALEFVQEAVPGLCPELLGADLELGFTLQEDLGQGASLVDVLSGDDPVAAEAALTAHADALGRLAAATRGRFQDWEALVRRRGAPETLLEPSPSASEIVECWTRVSSLLLEIGVDGDIMRAQEEFYRFLARLSDARGFAFSLGDTCPDNNRWDGAAIRLFDVDFCSYRHCLFDAAYYAAPFPTCRYVGRVPAAVEERVLAAYRRSVPIEQEDLVVTCCTWAILNLGWLLEQCLAEDGGLGPVGMRAMLQWRAASSAAQAAALGLVPALAGLLGSLGDALGRRWPEAKPPPTYPAFRSPA